MGISATKNTIISKQSLTRQRLKAWLESSVTFKTLDKTSFTIFGWIFDGYVKGVIHSDLYVELLPFSKQQNQRYYEVPDHFLTVLQLNGASVSNTGSKYKDFLMVSAYS